MNILQGEIWQVDLSAQGRIPLHSINPTIGDEISKKRVCLVVSSNSIGILKLRTVVPLTSWMDKFKDVNWMVKIDKDSKNGLMKTSCADTFQIRSLSINRFYKKIGIVDDEILFKIHQAVVKTLNPMYKILN